MGAASRRDLIRHSKPPIWKYEIRILFDSPDQPRSQRVLEHILHFHPVVFIVAKIVIVKSCLPDRCSHSGRGKAVCAVTLDCVHDLGEWAGAKLSDNVQMVGHHHCSIDSKSIGAVYPVNSIQHDVGVFLLFEYFPSVGNGCGEKVIMVWLGTASCAQVT